MQHCYRCLAVATFYYSPPGQQQQQQQLWPVCTQCVGETASATHGLLSAAVVFQATIPPQPQTVIVVDSDDYGSFEVPLHRTPDIWSLKVEVRDRIHVSPDDFVLFYRGVDQIPLHPAEAWAHLEAPPRITVRLLQTPLIYVKLPTEMIHVDALACPDIATLRTLVAQHWQQPDRSNVRLQWDRTVLRSLRRMEQGRPLPLYSDDQYRDMYIPEGRLIELDDEMIVAGLETMTDAKRAIRASLRAARITIIVWILNKPVRFEGLDPSTTTVADLANKVAKAMATRLIENRHEEKNKAECRPGGLCWDWYGKITNSIAAERNQAISRRVEELVAENPSITRPEVGAITDAEYPSMPPEEMGARIMASLHHEAAAGSVGGIIFRYLQLGRRWNVELMEDGNTLEYYGLRDGETLDANIVFGEHAVRGGCKLSS